MFFFFRCILYIFCVIFEEECSCEERTMRIIILCLLMLFFIIEQAGAARFVPLGDFPGGSTWSKAKSISADGKKVVGWSWPDPGIRAFFWSSDTGMRSLGEPDYDVLNACGARGVSAGGDIIFGECWFASKWYAPFIWTGKNGWQAAAGYFGHKDPPRTIGTAAISADGSRAVGFTKAHKAWTYYKHFLWTKDKGIRPLAKLFGTDAFLSHVDMSDDGSSIVGRITVENKVKAFHWTETGGLKYIHIEGAESCAPLGVSRQGDFLYGICESADNHILFRWSKNEPKAVAKIGVLPLGATAKAASEDGKVIVGKMKTLKSESQEYSELPSYFRGEAFIWKEDAGLQLLSDILKTEQGTIPEGWKLIEIVDVSADGKFIAGNGVNPGGDTEAFFVDLR
jgi:uncharacterized membrane protein